MKELNESTKTATNKERFTGTVIWFDNQRGYGFVKPDKEGVNDGKDVFCHFHGIIKNGFKELNKDDKVEFSLGSNSRGVVAIDVMRK